MTPGISMTRTGGTVQVALATPDGYNTISFAMWLALKELFDDLGADRTITGIVVTGAGRMFSAGADIADFAETRSSPEKVVRYEAAVDAACDAIAATPKPVIAAMRGYCLGGACNVAMACDFRFAASDLSAGIPAAILSIVYSTRGMARLLALVGLAEAKRIMFGGQRFGAEQALATGFIDRIAEDPVAEAEAYLDSLAGCAPLSIAGAKLILNSLSSHDQPFDPLAAEAITLRAAASGDYVEGREAFAQKRAPRFRGE